MSIDILKKDIKSKDIKNLYLFYGEEEYLKSFYLNSIENMILDESLKTMNKIVLEGKVDYLNIIDNMETFPVFSDKKLVIIKNSGLFKTSGKSKKNSKGDDLCSYLENIPSYTCVVFYENEIDMRSKLYKSVKKYGSVVEFTHQKPEELVKWVMKVSRSYGKQIDFSTASQLVDSCEAGMNEILNEVNKLILFVGERNIITSEDVNQSCIKSIKVKIFELTDAIGERNKAKALKLLDEMISLKEPIPKIIFMINRQLRQILQMKLLQNNGMNMKDIASKIGVASFAANKISSQARFFTVEKLSSVLKESLNFDLQIKTGRIKDRIAVELLIAELSK